MNIALLFVQVIVVSACATLKPSTSYLPKGSGNQIVKHQYYTLSYSEKDEQAEWVAYILSKASIEGSTKRKDEFRTDPDVTTGSAELSDYKKSGYDRGHLCPAGDMKYCKESMSESFFMSNMSPQVPAFNRVAWRLLEEQFRKWALDADTLFVVTGPVFTEEDGKIGANEVTVPKCYYKIALDPNTDNLRMIGFLMPNEKCNNPLDSYVVPVDSIEKVTGLDFYPDLPNKIEKELESSIHKEKWYSK